MSDPADDADAFRLLCGGSSSWIDSYSLSESQGDGNILTMATKVGEIYKYKGVPSDIWGKVVAAESAGKFHNSNLRGKYTCVKV